MEATGATVSYLLAKYHLYEFLVLLLIIYLKKIAHIRLHELLVAYIYACGHLTNKEVLL
jgi:hypothetical protein